MLKVRAAQKLARGGDMPPAQTCPISAAPSHLQEGRQPIFRRVLQQNLAAVAALHGKLRLDPWHHLRYCDQLQEYIVIFPQQLTKHWVRNNEN